MARTKNVSASARRTFASDDESDSVLPRNKENKAPALALSGKRGARSKTQPESDDDEAPAPRTKSAPAVSKRKPTAAKSKRSKKAASSDPDEPEDDEAEEAVEEETQDDDAMDIEPEGPTKKGRPTTTKGKKGGDEIALTAREKRLQAKLDLMADALKKVQLNFEQLRDLRETRAEASERALTEIAAERQAASMSMVQHYKAENEQLKVDLSAARAARFSSGSAGAPMSAEREEIARLQTELEKREAEEKERSEAKDTYWEKELAKTVKAKEEQAAKAMTRLQSDLLTAQQELQAEITHSKSLQSRLKSVSSSTLPAAVAPATGSNTAHQKLQAEFADLKSRLMLNEDLTGLVIVSVKMEDEPAYNCIMNDCLGKAGSLNFKLAFLHDGSATYDPDVHATRDPVMFHLLPSQFRSFMRFSAEDSGKWFRTLFKAVNKLD